MALDICLEVLEIVALPSSLCGKYGAKGVFWSRDFLVGSHRWLEKLSVVAGRMGAFSPEPGFVGSRDFALFCDLPQSLTGHTHCTTDMWLVFFTSLLHEGTLGYKLSAD